MIAKITVGTSLYGALAYNGLKVNEGEGRLLAVNRIFDNGSGQVDVARAEQDFKRFMPEQVRTRNKVIHISLNPHPDDLLTDMELEQLAREYLDRLGYGDQPYLVFKHEDISRHHLHIVSVNVDENGRRLNRDFIHRRSKRITSELEKKYGLHPADRRQHRTDNPLRRVDVSQGDVKRQVSNVAKAVMAGYKFRTMGEYRALLSLYNVTVEEAHGMVNGREYHGLVYSATDDAGNKTGNPFKASRIGKSVGYEAVQCRFEFSKEQIRDKRLAEMTRKTVVAALARTYRREEFVTLLRDKGVDVVFRHTDEGRIYGATFIDHRTGCVLNGSRLGREFSANALQEHFTLPYAGTPPMPFTIAVDGQQPDTRPAVEYDEGYSSGLGLLGGDASGAQAEEAAFERDLRRRRKKRRKGQGL
ncbi:conjugal transfer protein MobB [Bacteroides mediterraneensis]|uniref:conjugal transfer protein MobB n=1 Tax=Bacteroides mediterraneensis TaxID=1841856 RepID=UPI000934C942|nr:conjugal transfer protein MobB [Bacteroides mediterraneensis]